MEIAAHSGEWLIVMTNFLVAHVTISSVKASNHEYHYIRAPRVWRSVYCPIRTRVVHLKGTAHV